MTANHGTVESSTNELSINRNNKPMTKASEHRRVSIVVAVFLKTLNFFFV